MTNSTVCTRASMGFRNSLCVVGFNGKGPVRNPGAHSEPNPNQEPQPIDIPYGDLTISIYLNPKP